MRGRGRTGKAVGVGGAGRPLWSLPPRGRQTARAAVAGVLSLAVERLTLAEPKAQAINTTMGFKAMDLAEACDVGRNNNNNGGIQSAGYENGNRA